MLAHHDIVLNQPGIHHSYPHPKKTIDEVKDSYPPNKLDQDASLKKGELIFFAFIKMH